MIFTLYMVQMNDIDLRQFWRFHSWKRMFGRLILVITLLFYYTSITYYFFFFFIEPRNTALYNTILDCKSFKVGYWILYIRVRTRVVHPVTEKFIFTKINSKSRSYRRRRRRFSIYYFYKSTRDVTTKLQRVFRTRFLTNRFRQPGRILWLN